MTAAPQTEASGRADGANTWVIHDRAIVPASAVRLGASTQGLHYGTGVFEGIRAYASADERRGHVFRLLDHCDRFVASARILRIELGLTAQEFSVAILELLQRNAHKSDTYIRPIAFKVAREAGGQLGVRLRGVSSAFVVQTLAMPAYVPAEGLRCGVSRWRRVPNACLPMHAKITGAYANCALAREDAESSGWDDAILLNTAGQVAEATTANVFLVRQGRLVTPPPDADMLPGITRATVIDLARAETGCVAEQRPVEPAELYDADEIFLTGTGVEVVPVVELDGRRIGKGAPGELTRRLRSIYHDLVRARLPGYGRWLTEYSLANA